MSEDSMTAIEFLERYSTEDDCLDAIENFRWPKGFRCPNCDHDDGYRLKTRPLIQCSVCRHQTSMTAGTIFHKTRIPLKNWFWIIYSAAQDKGGVSSTRLAEQLGMYQKTVWNILHKIRHAMAKRDEAILLAGLIELDGMFVGSEARKMGRKHKNSTVDDCLGKPNMPRVTFRNGRMQTEVIVMVEAERWRAGSIAMRVVDSSSYQDIKEFAELRAEDNQVFKTDGFGSNYALRTVSNTHIAKTCSGEESVEWLPIVHRAISLVKRALLGTYHGVSPMYLQRYLDAFCFRFNRRNKPSSIASSLLRACVFAVPMTYAELKL